MDAQPDVRVSAGPRALDGRADALADGGLHRPRIDLFIGAGCNNDCIFCNEGGRRGRRRVYTLDEAAALLDRARGLETVFLTGGEPTLNRDLPRYAELARDRGVPHIALVTNGRRLARDGLAERLLTAGVGEIRVSVHGDSPALHDAHTRVTGSFVEVEAGLAALHELRARFSFTLIVLVVVTRENLPHVASIYRWARAAGADRVGFGIVRPSGLAVDHFDEVTPRYADVGSVFRSFLSELRLRDDPVNVDSVPPCLVPDDVAFVGARMRLVSLDEGDRLVQRDEFWEKTKGPPCERCLLRASCEGVWEGYAERFGWDEFPPVTRPPWGASEVGRCAPSRVFASGDALGAPLLSFGERCNNGCTVCARPRDAEEPDGAALLARLERYARAGAETVRLGGGEPTLSAALPDVLHRAAALGVRAELLTNARLLAYERVVRSLAANAPGHVRTVLHGADAAQHDAVTRVEGSFRQTLLGIRNARRAHWPVTVAWLPSPDAPVTDDARRALAQHLLRLGCTLKDWPD